MGDSKSKGKKAGKKAVGALKKLERKDFKITKLSEIDDFFSKIQAPMDTLSLSAMPSRQSTVASIC